jgi:Flp pilus assembly pilin Flp
MTNLIKNFAASESGAVTVDWVVLTAAIVGLGIAAMAVVSGGVEDLTRDIETQLLTDHVGATFGGESAESPVIE